jgi:hypothetical protein
MKPSPFPFTSLLRSLVFSFLPFLTSALGIGVGDPRVEYLQNPQGIDIVEPRLGWQLKSGQRGVSQQAYRILVASSLELLKADKGDLWDTGKVASGANIQIAYGGKPLASHQECHWKVMVWDQDNKPSQWSDPARWSMGLLQNTSYPSWGYSVEQGATTIWERWDSWTKEKGFNAGAMNSFNHYAYGSCSEWMFRSMLGIDTKGAGFKEIVMKPEIGHGITWAKGHYDSIHGRIASDWKLADGRLLWKVAVPANTNATIHVPVGSLGEVMEGGRPISQAPGVEILRQDEKTMVIRVGSGSYDFEAR